MHCDQLISSDNTIGLSLASLSNCAFPSAPTNNETTEEKKIITCDIDLLFHSHRLCFIIQNAKKKKVRKKERRNTKRNKICWFSYNVMSRYSNNTKKTYR